MSENNRSTFDSQVRPDHGAPAVAASSRQLWATRRGRILLLGTALMLILLALLGLAVRGNLQRLKAANEWNVHTYRVLERIERVSTLLDARESQLRGFVLTGEAQYLRQFRRSEGTGVRALGELRQLTRDRKEQQRALDVLLPEYLAYKRRFVSPYLRVALDGAQSQRLERVLRAQTAERERANQQLQARLGAMEKFERQQLQRRARALEVARYEAWRVLIGGSAFVIVLAVSLTVLLGRAVREQQEARERLNRLNESLIGEIAERRTAEELLRASEAGFRHLAEDSLDLICRHAPDGALTYVSPAARPLLGYDPVEMLGLHPSQFLFDKKTSDPDLSPAQQFAAQLENTRSKPLLRAYRHAQGHRVWLEVVGHAILDSQSGEVRAWHTAARDVSARVHEESERARLLAGLRAVVEIADELIAAPGEEELLKRAVEMMHRRIGLKRCSIYLSQPGESESAFSPLMRGTFGTDENGRAVREDDLLYNTQNDPNPDDITPAPGERWIVRRHQVRTVWQDGTRVPLSRRGWIARTPIVTRDAVLGLFFHDGAPGDQEHDAVEQQLVVVFCSLLGALLERGRSQQRMTRQQRLLESLMENAPLFLYSVDGDEKFTLATGNVLPAIGLTPKDMLGRRMSEIVPETSDSVQGMRRALRGETIQQELLFANRWLKMWRQPLRDDAGEINGMIGIGMDITQQHRAQIALRESEARYRQVTDSLQDALFQSDAQGRWTFLNPAWTEITGYSLAESLGAPCDNALWDDDDRAAFAALIAATRDASAAHAPARVLRFRTKNGQMRWLEVALRASFDGAGAFRGTAGTLRDVTDKLLAEDTLRETLEIKRAILQGASYAIVSTDANGLIQTFNPAAETLFGLSEKEVVGRATPAIFHDATELQARARLLSEELGQPVAPGFETLIACARRGQGGETEWTCLRADGTPFPMRISHSVLRDAQGEIAGYVSIGSDMSEAHRVEKLKSEFVSVVSHELRTPLTSIRGALGLLSGGVAGELPASAAQMIGIAQKNADRLVLLINDILDIEKIESGKMRFESAEISLDVLLQSALDANRGYAQTLGVEIELEPLAPALRAATLAGDEARLQQVMSNLLSNACKWTPRGSCVAVRALLAPDSTPENARVMVEVQDAGPGVPPEFESRLFERFSQADGSATREKGGTGLGLAVSQAIIEKHGGSLAYRAPDVAAGRVGATFYFEMDVRNVTLAPARQRMLVIEDDAECAALLRVILENAGYAVTVADSRAQALQRARDEEPPDGITLDLHLPDGHGFELLDELRALPATREVPVVVISAFHQERASDATHGIEHWFSKPVQPERLLAALAGGQPRRPDDDDETSGKARVLHVEDDSDVRHVVALILGDSSEVVTASTLGQARARLQSQNFDLALLDIGLPDGNGLDLLEQLNACQPPVPTLIFSAREEEAETATHVAAALIKSRTPNDALRAKVEELLERGAAS